MVDSVVLLPEVKELLESAISERGDLRYEQKLALEHARTFSRLSSTKARQLFEELLTIERITPELASKICDLCPTEPDELRAIFAKERFTLAEGDVKKILETIAKYL